MPVLVVNAGSSSLKLSVVGEDDEVIEQLTVERWDGEGDIDELRRLTRVVDLDAVGHRVVHGGTELTGPVRIDADVEARLMALVDLAPLHQPRSLAGVRAARRALPDLPHVACFDTTFHASLPEPARTYALPASWRQRWPLRRFGFHGLSHAWVARRAPEVAGLPPEDLCLVSCHLGAGASLCALRGGLSMETTMGFTPLEGLVMATRSGSVDPGLVLWLLEHGGLGREEVADGLEHRSGLAGLSGTSGDMRDVIAACEAGDGSAALAFDVYVHRLRREIAAMVAALGRLDVLVFTGGVGEHAPEVRAAAVEGLGFLDLALDASANATLDGDADVSAPEAAVRTVVVRSREDLEIAAQVRAVLAA